LFKGTPRAVPDRIAFSIWFLLQDDASTIEDFREENSRMLGNYSRRLQDYSRIGWSTFQPVDGVFWCT
jgi:hypothetical protein